LLIVVHLLGVSIGCCSFKHLFERTREVESDGRREGLDSQVLMLSKQCPDFTQYAWRELSCEHFAVEDPDGRSVLAAADSNVWNQVRF